MPVWGGGGDFVFTGFSLATVAIMERMLAYQDKVYYLNSNKPSDSEYHSFFAAGKRKRPTEEVDYFLAQRKHNSFHPQHLHQGFEDISFIRGFFKDLEQPSEDTVRRAMIFQISDQTGQEGPENKYCLKAGGGSKSDSIFSSSYSILIADPQTGYDKSVVLLKKFSTRFADVLITAEEISDLFEIVASPAQKAARDNEFAMDIIGLLMASMRSGKVHYSKGNAKTLTPALLTDLITKNKPKAPIRSFEHAFSYFEKRFTDNLKIEIVEDDPKVNRTQQYRQINQDSLKHLSNLKRMFLPTSKHPLGVFPAGAQIQLFA